MQIMIKEDIWDVFSAEDATPPPDAADGVLVNGGDSAADAAQGPPELTAAQITAKK
jgi:hypothetical protein